MKIMEFLNKKAITIDLKAKDKPGVIKELIDLLIKAGSVKPREKDSLVKTLMEREALGSTGIGLGIGIPHGKSQNARELVGAFGMSKEGVDFESLDGELAYIFFLLIAPANTAGPHLKALARISRLLRDKYLRDSLRSAKDEKEVIKIISDEDRKA